MLVDAVVPGTCTGVGDVECHIGMRPAPGDYVVQARSASELDCRRPCYDDEPPGADWSCAAESNGEACDFDIVAPTPWNGACEAISIVFGDDPR